MNKTTSSTVFSKAILDWYDEFGRKDLPWQNTKDPYRIWVSEIMLQQTQVATVIPYYRRFMDRFSNIIDLANAPQDEVLHHWTGLGYYARARNLQKAAQIIRDDYAGIFPTEIEKVIDLPGIGKSTAGAILSFSKNQHHAILDGNVKRSLSRYFGVFGWPGKLSVQKELWELAEANTPKFDTNKYTQAIMDFGATLCKRSKPSCDICPVQTSCFAFASELTKELPTKKAKKAIPVRNSIFLIINNNDGDSLLIQRPPSGIWGSLWCFPEIPIDASQALSLDSESVTVLVEESLGITISSQNIQKPFRHTFSHFHLDITPINATLINGSTLCMNDSNQIWYKPTKHLQIGLAAPIKKLLEISP